MASGVDPFGPLRHRFVDFSSGPPVCGLMFHGVWTLFSLFIPDFNYCVEPFETVFYKIKLFYFMLNKIMDKYLI